MPLVSLETRGIVYIEFGGEGEIRNYPFAVLETKAAGLQGLQPGGARRICPMSVPWLKCTRLQKTITTGVLNDLC